MCCYIPLSLLFSPTSTGTSTAGRATVTPSSNVQPGPTEMYADIHQQVPHQTAATGEQYAVSTKKPTKPQGPTEEYAQVDKSKKSGQQKVSIIITIYNWLSYQPLLQV